MKRGNMSELKAGDFIVHKDYPKGLWLLYVEEGQYMAFCIRNIHGRVVCETAGNWNLSIEKSITVASASLISKVLLQIHGEGV